MADQPGVWGIDVGQCALKAIRLVDVDGQVTATAFDYVEHPKILSQPDADPDQLVLFWIFRAVDRMFGAIMPKRRGGGPPVRCVRFEHRGKLYGCSGRKPLLVC